MTSYPEVIAGQKSGSRKRGDTERCTRSDLFQPRLWTRLPGSGKGVPNFFHAASCACSDFVLRHLFCACKHRWSAPCDQNLAPLINF